MAAPSVYEVNKCNKTEHKDSSQQKSPVSSRVFTVGSAQVMVFFLGVKTQQTNINSPAPEYMRKKILLSLVHLPEQTTTFHYAQLRFPPLASQSSIFMKIHTCRTCNPVYN